MEQSTEQEILVTGIKVGKQTRCTQMIVALLRPLLKTNIVWM